MERKLSDRDIKCLLKPELFRFASTSAFNLYFSLALFTMCNEVIESINFRIQIAFRDKLLTSQCERMQTQIWTKKSEKKRNLVMRAQIIILDTNCPADLRTNLLQSEANITIYCLVTEWTLNTFL